MADSRQFAVQFLRPSEDVALVVAEGEIDIFTAPRLQEAIEKAIESDIRRLIVDVAGVSFIDSTGLSPLIVAFRRLTERGAHIDIVGSQANVTRVFKVTGLQSVFTFYANREEALAATEPDPPA